jgi:Spy/CpxP family protein refolding chaperone
MVAGLRTRTRWALIAAGTLAYTALSLAVFAQAVAGRPLLPL